MPVTLKSLLANKKTVEVAIGNNGETLTVVYYPAKLTERALQELHAINGDTIENTIDGMGAINKILIRLIASWDLFIDDEKTERYSLTDDALAELPIDFRTSIFHAIMGDLNPESLASRN